MFFSYLAAYFWAIQKDQNIERLMKKFSLGKWKTFIIFLVVFLIIINAGHDGLIRRFLGFFNSAPIWGLFLLYAAKAWKKRGLRSWIIWLPAVGFLFSAIPGLQLGSFFGGISGWVIRAEKSDPIHIGGYKLVNKNEETHWLAHAIFQPHGQIGRFRRAFLAMPNTGEREFMQFSFETYKRIFPGIERGNFLHQWALGDFAYPTHSLQKYDTKVLAEHFRPKDIVEIIKVSEKYNYEGVAIEKKIKHRLKITE